MPKRMLSRKQCVFIIVVLPLLIIPALMIIQHADGRLDDVFIPPRRAAASRDVQSAARQSLMKVNNRTAVRSYMKPPIARPVKCFDYIWTGSCRDTCFTFNTQNQHRQRKQLVLKCEKSKTQLKTLYTSKSKYVFKIPFQDPCLRKVVDWYCHDSHRVPNIVHYVWFGKVEFNFIHFLSFLSAHKVQSPCLIMLHADKLPKGPLWNYFLQISPRVIQVKRKQPRKIQKKKLVYIEQKADIAKLEALKEYGGIYLDTDQVILKPLDKFRNNDATIGLDYSTQVANSMIISAKNSAFIKHWYDSYRTFSRNDGNKHSQIIPYKLSKKYPDLVKVAGNLLSASNAHQLSDIYVKNQDWSTLYGIHMHLKLQLRFYEDRLTLESIKTMNTTAGAVARWIIYGNTDTCQAKTFI